MKRFTAFVFTASMALACFALEMAAQASSLSPEEERASFTLPPGFVIELVAQEDDAAGIGKFVTVEWDQHGRMWSMTALEGPMDGTGDSALAKAQYAKPGCDKVLIFDTPFAPGVQTPRVFADGLVNPRGILPYKEGCFVQNGPDILFLSCTDEKARKELEGVNLSRYGNPDAVQHERISILQAASLRLGANRVADSRHAVLSGFGVQNAHHLPHLFTRVPGGWIWLAQGAANFGTVRRSHVPLDWAQQINGPHVAKFHPDGSVFGFITAGPCNVSGLVLTGEGECFIQNEKDAGCAVVEFHEFANYPGCFESPFFPEAPEFPGTPGMTMGGDALSGLALSDKTPWPKPYADVMYVANSATRQIQAVKITPDGPRDRHEKLPDFLSSSDEWFHPAAIRFGPDGCLYIVDSYEKSGSPNDPERDKTRGRIWRVKATAQKPFDVPDFTKLTADQLLAKLGGPSLTQSHLAWQAIGDRQWDSGDGENGRDPMGEKLAKIIKDKTNSPARRIQAVWALQEIGHQAIWIMDFPSLARDKNPAIRRALVHAERDNNHYTTWENATELRPLVNDPDPGVRALVIKVIGQRLEDGGGQSDESVLEGVKRLVEMTKPSLPGPLAPSTRDGEPVKVREAYDRAFERFLIRWKLQDAPRIVAMYLDSREAAKRPVEARLLAALSLPPKDGARRVAQLVPKLTRAPTPEEVLRLAEFLDQPGVGDALCDTLQNLATRAATLDVLLARRTELDVAKLTPFLADAAEKLRAKGPGSKELAAKLSASFALPAGEPALLALAQGGSPGALPALRALATVASRRSDVFAQLIETSPEADIRDAALEALLASRAADVPQRALALYPQLPPAQQRIVLEKLSAKTTGAAAIIAALHAGKIPASQLDPPVVDRLQATLGPDEPIVAKLVDSFGPLFRPVLQLNGENDAYTGTILDLEGPFTVETWVRLDPARAGRQTISDADAILSAVEQIDMNFWDARLRVWIGGGVGDAIVSKKPMTPGVWTHVAVTRNADGFFKIYQDGELTADKSKAAPGKFGKVFIAASGAAGGTAGALAEYRIWDRERTAEEIREAKDRRLTWRSGEGLVFTSAAPEDWGTLHDGAKVVKTSAFPPVLSDEKDTQPDAKGK